MEAQREAARQAQQQQQPTSLLPAGRATRSQRGQQAQQDQQQAQHAQSDLVTIDDDASQGAQAATSGRDSPVPSPSPHQAKGKAKVPQYERGPESAAAAMRAPISGVAAASAVFDEMVALQPGAGAGGAGYGPLLPDQGAGVGHFNAALGGFTCVAARALPSRATTRRTQPSNGPSTSQQPGNSSVRDDSEGGLARGIGSISLHSDRQGHETHTAAGGLDNTAAESPSGRGRDPRNAARAGGRVTRASAGAAAPAAAAAPAGAPEYVSIVDSDDEDDQAGGDNDAGEQQAAAEGSGLSPHKRQRVQGNGTANQGAKPTSLLQAAVIPGRSPRKK